VQDNQTAPANAHKSYLARGAWATGAGHRFVHDSRGDNGMNQEEEQQKEMLG